MSEQGTLCPARAAHGLPQPITAHCTPTRVKYFALGIYEEPLSAEERSVRALYRGVIAQMVTDAASNSKKPKYVRAKKAAIQWFGSDDFVDVCLMAGWTPEGIMRNIKFAEERGYQWRLPAGKCWRTKLKQEKENANYCESV